MVLSYVTSLWRFKVASLLASSMAVAISYGNARGSFRVGGKFDGRKWWQKKGETMFWWQKGWQLFMAKNWSRDLAITFWRRQKCQHLMAVSWAGKVASTLGDIEALSVRGMCWQKGCERLFGGKFWAGRLMEKSAGKLWGNQIMAALVRSQRRQHPPTSWIEHETKQILKGWHIVFNNLFAGGTQAASVHCTLFPSRQPTGVFGCHQCPSKNKAYFRQK